MSTCWKFDGEAGQVVVSGLVKVVPSRRAVWGMVKVAPGEAWLSVSVAAVLGRDEGTRSNNAFGNSKWKLSAYSREPKPGMYRPHSLRVASKLAPLCMACNLSQKRWVPLPGSVNGPDQLS